MGSYYSRSLSTFTGPEALFRSRPKLTSEDVQSLHFVSHYVYALLSLHVYNNPNTPPLPSEWEILLTAADLKLDKEGYFATAYINKELRHCIIAQRGTTNALSLRAGVWTYFDEQTILFSLARQFSKQVRLHLSITRGSTPEWFISYTGHSLGAVLAACRAVEEQTHAVTFESPGCKNFIEHTMNPFKAEDADIITYLRPPNPINTLRPHCGYVIQLPFESDKNAPLQSRVVSTSMLRLPSIPTPQEFLRGQIPRVVGIPDIQQYVGKIEPLLREMLEHTQQVHAMTGILDHFKEKDELLHGQVVLRWPSTLMQFLEYYNAKKALEDPVNQEEANLRCAYESLIRHFYLTAERQKKTLPLRFLNGDSVKILWLWSREDPAKLAKLPLTVMDHKVLNTITIEDDCMRSSILTAFQAKQYLSLLIFRPEIHKLISQLVFDPLLGNRIKSSMNMEGAFSYKDISSLVELLDKNKEFKRPDGQTVGYSLQEANTVQTVSSSNTTVQANPLNISLPATVVDHQLRLPVPSESREAKKIQATKHQASKPKGYAIWSEEELAAAFRERHDTTLRPKDGVEEPEHTILYQDIVTAEDIYLGMDATKAVGGSSGLLLKVTMPKLERLADLAIAVDPCELRLSSSKYYLQAALPHKVVAGKANAKWDGDKKTLSVSLTIDTSERIA